MDFLHKIPKKINGLTEKREIKATQNIILKKESRNLSVAKYANLKIAKLTCRENVMYFQITVIFKW